MSKVINRDAIYLSIEDAAEVTGLSRHYLWKGCTDGTIVHTKSGRKFYIHMPSLLKKPGRKKAPVDYSDSFLPPENDCEEETKNRRVQLLLTPSLYDKAAERATEMHQSVSELARRALKAYLKSDVRELEESKGFDFAIWMLKQGYRMTRRGWNGKDQYIDLATGISYTDPAGHVVNEGHLDMGNASIAFHGTRGVQIGWLASQADMLADDWEVALLD